MWESMIPIKMVSFFVVLNLLTTYVETFSTNKGPNLYGCIGGSGYHKIAGLQFYFFILVLCWWRLFFFCLFFFALLFRFHFFPFLRAFFFLFLLLILLIIWNVNQWINTLCVSLKHSKIHILKFLPKKHCKYYTNMWSIIKSANFVPSMSLCTLGCGSPLLFGYAKPLPSCHETWRKQDFRSLIAYVS